MNKANFVGGPLGGQTRFVNDNVHIVVYPNRVETVPGWEYSWLFGGFVWRGEGEPDLSKPPATYENVTYRRFRDTDEFILQRDTHWVCATCFPFERYIAGEEVVSYCGQAIIKKDASSGPDCEECLEIERSHEHGRYNN